MQMHARPGMFLTLLACRRRVPMDGARSKAAAREGYSQRRRRRPNRRPAGKHASWDGHGQGGTANSDRTAGLVRGTHGHGRQPLPCPSSSLESPTSRPRTTHALIIPSAGSPTWGLGIRPAASARVGTGPRGARPAARRFRTRPTTKGRDEPLGLGARPCGRNPARLLRERSEESVSAARRERVGGRPAGRFRLIGPVLRIRRLCFVCSVTLGERIRCAVRARIVPAPLAPA
jgi:hypothetical protein